VSKIPLLVPLAFSTLETSTFWWSGVLLFMKGRWPVFSWYRKSKKPMMTESQYKLYDMTEP
jgi:hypothetical protein